MRSRLLSGALRGLWLGALVLALAEAYRPGFLAIGSEGSTRAILIVLLPFLLLGLATAVIRKSVRPVQKPLQLILGAWLLVAALPLAGHLLAPSMPAPRLATGWRVVVLGVDGATWEVIGSLADQLPNFSRLQREGATGDLTSEEPTLSPRVWTTIASGVGPERHGALDFYSTQASITVSRIWEVVEATGGRIGVFNWLLTWPPGTPNGFVVPGWMARGTETFPPELSFLQRLREDDTTPLRVRNLLTTGISSFRNGVRLPTLLRGVETALWIKLARPTDRMSTPRTSVVQAEMSADVFLHWWRRTGPDFGALVLYATDNLAHRHWRDFEPHKFGLDAAPDEGHYRDAIPSAYRQADRTLGRLFVAADERTILAVISDHGTEAREGTGQITSIDAAALIRALGMEGRLTAFSVGDILYLRQPTADGEPGEEPPPFVSVLEQATVAGDPLFEVNRSAPPYFSVAVAGDPDLDAEVRIAGRTLPLSTLLVRSRFSGEHTLGGIIGLWGPPIAAGGRITDATIRDVAPTVLALLGSPLSRQLTGRVLEEALRPEARAGLVTTFVDDYGPPPHSLRGETPEADVDEALQEKLRALGYLE